MDEAPRYEISCGTGDCGRCFQMLPLFENPMGAVARCLACRVAEDLERTHELKCLSEYFEHVVSGRKRFEVRKNDRGFRVGDVLRIVEVTKAVGESPVPTGRSHDVRVTYILSGMDVRAFGIQDGFAVLGIQDVFILSQGRGADYERAATDIFAATIRNGVPDDMRLSFIGGVLVAYLKGLGKSDDEVWEYVHAWTAGALHGAKEALEGRGAGLS